MSPEKMIESDDIEVAQLGVNILLETISIEKIKDLLSRSKFHYRRDDDKFIFFQFSDYDTFSMFVKDPTRTLLINLDNGKNT